VGSAVLQTLLDQADILKERFDVDVQIKGVTNSSRMLIGDNINGNLRESLQTFNRRKRDNQINPMSPTSLRRTHSNISFEDIAAKMSSSDETVSANLEVFYEHLRKSSTPHIVMIDCTNSSEIADLHPSWIRGGAHVITANKRGLSSSLSLYNDIFSASKLMNRLYMSEVTIGASIPVMTTLHDLICSGDAIHSIVGLMSVSLGMVLKYICEDGLSLSDAISSTYSTGLFEDDVFLDLEGVEAAQKLLILARALGISLSMKDIEVEPLAKRRNVSSWTSLTTEFASEDISIANRAKIAAEKGCTLRYVQKIECSPPSELGLDTSKINVTASVKLEEVPVGSSLAQVQGAIYYFSFRTERYASNPLVIQVCISHI
jgi:aspartokinase/homoserine dehydrogenase 1